MNEPDHLYLDYAAVRSEVVELKTLLARVYMALRRESPEAAREFEEEIEGWRLCLKSTRRS